MVGEKMFLVLGLGQIPIGASFKVNTEDFEEFSTRYGFKPAPYMARNKWVSTNDISNFTIKEWEEIIAVSYGLIKSKLTKKLQRQIDGQLG